MPTTIAFCCGRCLDVKRAHYEPDACFACGARFDRGAPLAMLGIEIVVGATVDRVGVGVGVSAAPRERVDFLGEWTVETREIALAKFGVVEDQDAPGRAVDVGKL